MKESTKKIIEILENNLKWIRNYMTEDMLWEALDSDYKNIANEIDSLKEEREETCDLNPHYQQWLRKQGETHCNQCGKLLIDPPIEKEDKDKTEDIKLTMDGRAPFDTRSLPEGKFHFIDLDPKDKREGKTLGDYNIWYQPCEKCGYDTGKSTPPKEGNKTCWKCGNFVKRDYTDRALKDKTEGEKK